MSSLGHALAGMRNASELLLHAGCVYGHTASTRQVARSHDFEPHASPWILAARQASVGCGLWCDAISCDTSERELVRESALIPPSRQLTCAGATIAELRTMSSRVRYVAIRKVRHATSDRSSLVRRELSARLWQRLLRAQRFER